MDEEVIESVDKKAFSLSFQAFRVLSLEMREKVRIILETTSATISGILKENEE